MNPKLTRKSLISSLIPHLNLDDHEDPNEEFQGGETSAQNTKASSEENAPGISTGNDENIIEEHLHQLFVTKNPLLCNIMKKSFYKMAAAYEFSEGHLDYESYSIPTSLDKFDDLAFPAFLTARQFYMLLDRSLEDGKSFFKRPSDQVKVITLDYGNEDQDGFWDLEESDSEDDYVKPNPAVQQAANEMQSEIWTEVTALYFKEIIWPKISHKCKNATKIDPMLVWLEIQSFIKGSEHAVLKGSPLSFDEYREVGNKKAPNFSSHRELIYELYEFYQRYRLNHRHSNLFDECDLIMNLHQRINEIKDVRWSIQSVYIDEVQDFTQSELTIFIRCCRDPNSMFFTGDTAQSIMRGISFRFQDLRSIFSS